MKCVGVGAMTVIERLGMKCGEGGGAAAVIGLFKRVVHG